MGFVNKNGQRFKRYLSVTENDIYHEMSAVYRTKEYVYSQNPILQTNFSEINALVFYNHPNNATIADSKLIVKFQKISRFDSKIVFIIHIDEKEPNCEYVSSALGSVLFRLTDFYFQLCASCTEASHFTTVC